MKQLFITSVRDFEKNTMGTVEMREMPMPEPAEDEVRIKIIYSSICGSDAHTLTGHLGEFEEGTKAMLPMTFGHELSGVIDKVGPKAEALGYHVGDKVIASKYAGTAVKLDGVEYTVLSEDDILATVE